MCWRLTSPAPELFSRVSRIFIVTGYSRQMGIRITTSCLIAVGLVLGLSSAAPLQARPAPGDEGARIVCESIAERWNHCALPFKGEARMLRQLSRNACIRHQSWGQDEKGVWVAGGCRAEFGVAVADSDADPDEAPSSKRRLTLRCESRSGGPVHCPAETAQGVRLTRQLSSFECELGRSWGFDADGIWVARGCRAEFEVIGTASPRRSGWLSRLFKRDGGDAVIAGSSEGRALRCESRDGARRECTLSGATRVDMVRQLSNAACTQGVGWGWNAEQLWVDRGCRAEFIVW